MFALLEGIFFPGKDDQYAATFKQPGNGPAAAGGKTGNTRPITERKREMTCDKKNLEAGIKEMQSVAARLLAWAEDLEKCSAHGETAPPEPPSRDAVKAFLTNRCAAGYAAQVKDLIASFGAKTLSEVPDGSLAALMESAARLG